MKQHVSLRSNQSIRRSFPAALAAMVTIGLACLLPVTGCNKTASPPPTDTAATSPAPPPAAAPPPDTTATSQAPPPAAVPPRAAAPVAPSAPSAMSAAPARIAPPPAPPRQYTVPAGTPFVVRVAQTISAKSSNVGDSFNGFLAQSVVVDGVSVIRAGAPVTGTVVASKGQGRFKGSGDLGIALRRVSTYTVSTSSYEATAKGKGKRTAGFIGGGGGGGALIGGLAGGGKGALIGGLLGAGAGTAGAALTGNKDITIPAEAVVTFTLSAPITVVQARGKKAEE